MTDQELKDLIASLAITHEKSVIEADRRFARLEEQLTKAQAQWDKRFAETEEQLNRRFAETEEQLNRRFAETEEQLNRRFAETNAQLAKTDAQLAKTDKQLKRLSDMLGGTVNNQGQAVEEFFYSSLLKQLRIGDMKFDAIYRNLGGQAEGVQDEFDIILANRTTVAVFEVKTKAHVNFVDTMLRRKIPNFRKVLPNFKEHKIYAGIASLVTYEELIAEVQQYGLFLLTQQGDHIEIVNQEVTCF
jgi:chromosome segregation ATPase